jgi:hypothetical protein
MAEGGNKCNGECHPIYPTEDQHIKQRVKNERFLGSKGQFCAAFYHVHQWNHSEHSCLDDNHCIVAKEAKKSPKGWYVQARKVVAVVKFEDENGDILHEARYKNCAPEQKHAVDFFKQDIENENGELRKLVEANPNGTITLYLTLQPCNKSTIIGGAAFTPPDKTSCETLTAIVNEILLPRNISLCVKAANTSRLSLTPEDDANDEILRQNAVAGIEMLMQVGVKFSGMTEEDWKYLLSFTDVLEGYEHLAVHGNRQHLDASVQNIFDQIQAQINPA